MFNLNQKMGGLCCRILPALLAGFMMALFTGCSNEGPTDGPLTGGGAEETGVYALDNMTLAGTIQSHLASSTDGNLSGSNGFPFGLLVRIYELDSVTLEKTDNRLLVSPDANGMFKVDRFSVKSPYLFIETEIGQNPTLEDVKLWRCNLIDLRKTRSLVMNVMTTLATPRHKNLMLSGMDFETARAKAEKEVLDAFVIREEMPSFDMMGYQENEIHSKAAFLMMSFLYTMGSDYIISVAEDIGEDGKWDGDWEIDPLWNGKYMQGLYWSNTIENVRGLLLGEMSGDLFEFKSYLAYDDKDTSDADLMNLARSYLFNLFEVTDNLGRCTAERQGEKTSIVSNTKEIVCDSGFWSVMEQGYVHEDGEMVDSRDGKTYKTITINVKGEPVTWMAENLAYEVPSSVCFNNEEENCQKYGRMYTLDVSHGIEIDSLQMLIDGDKYEVAEVMSGRNSQGICPDGWRLPRLSDWEKFTKYYGGGRLTQMRDRLVDGADPKYDIGFNASMGGTGSMDLESKEFSFYSLGEGIDYAMWDGNGNQFRMSFAETFMQPISLSISYEDVDVVYVRCVKQ